MKILNYFQRRVAWHFLRMFVSFSMILGLAVFILMMARDTSLRSGISRRLYQISGYEEACGMRGVSFWLKKGEPRPEFMKRLILQAERLEKILGPPIVRGNIIVLFHPILGADRARTKTGRIWPPGRTIEFQDESINEKVLCHECVHALYQTRSFISNSPRLAVEGSAEALAYRVTGSPFSFLDPGFLDYYLKGMHRLIDPDAVLSRNMILRNICYSIAGLFFQRCHDADPAFFIMMFSQRPKTRWSWENLMQKLIDGSSCRDRLLTLVAESTVFGSCSQHLFAVPLLENPEFPGRIILYLDLLRKKSQVVHPVEVEEDIRGIIRRKTILVMFDQGIAEVQGLEQDIMLRGRIGFSCLIHGLSLKTNPKS